MSLITETVRRTVFVMVSMEMFQKPGEQKKSWVSFVSFFMAAYAIRMGFDKSTLNYAAVKGREHKVTIDKMNLENDECLCESAFIPGTGSAINSMC